MHDWVNLLAPSPPLTPQGKVRPMTAPALILVASGTEDRLAAESLHHLRKKLQVARPDIQVSLAFLDTCPPSGPQVLSALTGRGIDEVVFVPLDLTRAIDAHPMLHTMVANATAAHPGVRFAVARPVGPAVELLNVLDDMMREALRREHVAEIDALVLSTRCTGDARGNALLARRARQWAAHHHLPVQVAAADGTHSVVQAVQALRAEGRRHIAVGSLWLAGDETFWAQRAQALATGAVAVSDPFSDHDVMLGLVLARYAFAAMELLTDEMLGLEEVDAPAETVAVGEVVNA